VTAVWALSHREIFEVVLRVLFLAGALCCAVGMSLGGLGGGGSVLSLPMLVYIAGLGTREAIGISSIIVGCSAAAAVAVHARRGNVDWKTGCLFAAAGIPSALASAHVSNFVPPHLLLGSFAVLLVCVSLWMFFAQVGTTTHPRSWPVIALVGAGIGLVAGFFGVGGGFVIVPALTGLAGLDLRRAIGTSLFIITINSVTSMIEHVNHNMLPLTTTAAFAGMTVVGALIGQQVASRMSTTHLRRGFAMLVLVVACLVAWRVLSGR
jgi:uncharacterized protein